MELEIKGNPRYVKRMYKHLRKEHPSTRKTMTMENGNNECPKKKQLGMRL